MIDSNLWIFVIGFVAICIPLVNAILYADLKNFLKDLEKMDES